MSSRREELGRSRFHHYGPWILGGTAVVAGLAYEIAHKHVVSRSDVVFFVVLVPTIVLHEISHGAVAFLCGDRTAKDAKRLSLNPLRHVDPIGTLLLPILLILSNQPAFGWAKPVPVDVSKLRHPRNQSVLVGLVGPATNFAIALGAGFLLRAVVSPVVFDFAPLSKWPLGDLILLYLGEVNVFVGVFNLIPIPPLDGSAVVERLLPQSLLESYYRIRPFTILLVLFFVFVAPSALDSLFNHALQYWADIVF